MGMDALSVVVGACRRYSVLTLRGGTKARRLSVAFCADPSEPLIPARE